GSSAIQYKTAQASYQVSAGSFFQTNSFLIDELISIVVGERHGDSALDLYAGAGLFALPLSHRFKHVVAVEAAPASAQNLVANAAHNINVVRQTTENYLASAKFKRQEDDLIVVDPPRFGLGEAVTRLLGPLEAKQIVYVSCDPATLARDLKALGEHGWLIQELHLVDLFPQTFHLETVTVLTR
ncbi:MAG TPA: RsmD family RNA methyltransferase, partial [Terriglobales bacterium]